VEILIVTVTNEGNGTNYQMEIHLARSRASAPPRATPPSRRKSTKSYA
jgi:hypothetical protein